MQAAIEARLQGLPGDTSSNHHRTTVLLPRGLAVLLARDSTLLGRLARVLVARDGRDTRVARAMARVKQEDMARVRVTFSKCLYAMVQGVQVQPYKASSWVVGEAREEVLGFKLATALEILLSQSKGQKGSGQDGQDFVKFLSKLQDVGFFQGELEGSIRHKQLMEDAKAFWTASKAAEQESDASQDLLWEFKAALDVSEVPDNFMIGPAGTEDPEDWLDVTPESLDAMLEAQFGLPKSGGAGQNIPEEVSRLVTMDRSFYCILPLICCQVLREDVRHGRGGERGGAGGACH